MTGKRLSLFAVPWLVTLSLFSVAHAGVAAKAVSGKAVSAAVSAATASSASAASAVSASTTSAASASAAAGAATVAGVPAVVQSTCMACHGMQGIAADGGMFPNLAGQVPQYLLRQLHHFQTHVRADPDAPIMWGMAAPLTPAQISRVVEYFSSQKPATGHVYDPKLVAEGRKLYYGGLPAKQMPACMACHGTGLAGLPPFFPRLAGQKRTYVINQLTYFKSGQRVATHKGIMNYIASRLTPQQITELAAFIRSR